jgi:hypothetical protein
LGGLKKVLVEVRGKGEGVIRSQKKKDLDGLFRKRKAGGRRLLTGAVVEVAE